MPKANIYRVALYCATPDAAPRAVPGELSAGYVGLVIVRHPEQSGEAPSGVVVLCDFDHGASLTNAAESVCRYVFDTYLDAFEGMDWDLVRWIYRDTMGAWGEIVARRAILHSAVSIGFRPGQGLAWARNIVRWACGARHGALADFDQIVSKAASRVPGEQEAAELVDVFSGYVIHPGGRIQVDFQLPVGATEAERAIAFVNALSQRAEVGYLAMGTSRAAPVE